MRQGFAWLEAPSGQSLFRGPTLRVTEAQNNSLGLRREAVKTL